MKRGTFTSVWDDGVEITSPAELDEKTGEVTVLETAEVNGVETLEEEYFTDEDGKRYEICKECHCFIMKTIMVDGIGHCLDEKSVCSDPDCENGENNM